MAWKTVGLAAAGTAAGFIAAQLVHGSSNPDASIARVPAIPVESVRTVATRTAAPAPDPRIAQLKSEIAALQAADAGKIRKSSQEMAQRAIDRIRQGDSDSLVAAGFSQQRLDWLKNRAEELLSERKRAEEDSRSRGGTADRTLTMALLEATTDKDILLLSEITEAEFERYRAALGKSAGVEVTAVPAGSNAERAGIRPGDEILSYGGRRVIDVAAMNMFAQQSPPVGSVAVEVRRDGKKIRLSAPSGPIHVKARRTPASF